MGARSASAHGEVQAGQVANQIGSFDGLCGPAPDFAGCADRQVVVFLAVDNGG